MFGGIMTMEVDMYRAIRHWGKFLLVPAGTDVSKMKFPMSLDHHLRKVRLFKAQLGISPEKPRIGLDTREVINQIAVNGFAQQWVKPICTTPLTTLQQSSARN
jgi:hypothetical protein